MMVPSKSLFVSKTFWLALLSPLAGWLTSKYGLDLSAAQQDIVAQALGALAAAVIAVRLKTSPPVHIVKPAGPAKS